MIYPFKIGPDGLGGYRYMIGSVLSSFQYANSASAKHDAEKFQVLTDQGYQPEGSLGEDHGYGGDLPQPVP
jgi:hypothetical protein